MPVAEIITIGTELLLGEIQDTNTRYLARALRDAGINIYRTMTVGDNVNRIAQAIREALDRADIIITTGGLGPTIDDPTRQAVAKALGIELEYKPELWDHIVERFKRYGRSATENNKRQAYIPSGAIAIKNPVGTAPAFICETSGKAVISLPGVPREMEYLLQNEVMPYLQDHFQLHGTIKARVLHAGGVGESQIDEMISDLEELANPTVGLAAHAGQIDIRITAHAETLEQADELIESVAKEIYRRLGDHVYGEDEDTFETIIQRLLSDRGWKLAVLEAGMENELLTRLPTGMERITKGELVRESLSLPELRKSLIDLMSNQKAQAGVAASLKRDATQQEFLMVLTTPEGTEEQQRYYGGPPQMAAAWAANQALDWIRRDLQKIQRSINGKS